MVKQKESKPSKRRTQVKDLPTAKKKITTKEMKTVKGGSGEVQTVTLSGLSSGSFKQSGRK